MAYKMFLLIYLHMYIGKLRKLCCTKYKLCCPGLWALKLRWKRKLMSTYNFTLHKNSDKRERELLFMYLCIFAPKPIAALVQIYIQNPLPQHLLTMARKSTGCWAILRAFQIELYCESVVNVSVGHLQSKYVYYIRVSMYTYVSL